MDESYELATPENVPISYELAGIGSRFIAAILDQLIIWTAVTGLVVAVLVANNWVASASSNLYVWLVRLGPVALALLGLALFVILFGYALIFEIAWSGQTPGKRIAGLRVVRDDGSPITALAAVIRNLMRIIDSLPAYYIIGLVTMLIDRRCRRMGDLAAGTIVVKERRDITIDRLVLEAEKSGGNDVSGRQEDPAEGFERLSRLSYEDYHLVKEYLLRRKDLSPDAAKALGARIAGIVAKKLEVAISDGATDDFLARVARALEQTRRK